MNQSAVGSTSSDDFEALLGGDILAAIDQPLNYTVFEDPGAKTATVRSSTLRRLAAVVHQPEAAEKSRLPLLKLGEFGPHRTDRGSLRSNDNLESVSGIEADYDAGKVSIDEGMRRLEAAGLGGLIYTSPSHRPNAPRWRILCALSRPVKAIERERLCARLNGALGGILAPESFTASQSYYFGRVRGGAVPEVRLVDGRALDLADELDACALGKGGTRYVAGPDGEAEPSANDNAPDWTAIDEALAMIPVADADSAETGGRDLYLDIGKALHHASGGTDEGRTRWEEWAKGGVKFNARHLARDWASFARRRTGKPVTVGTLYRLARPYGWSPITADWFDAEDAPGHAPTPLPTADAAALTELGTAPTPLRFLSPAECAETPSRGYVIKGLAAPADLVCIFGAPGAGKSLIAPHIAYAVARGAEVFGMRTRAGAVMYVAAEDPHGMRGRIAALRRRQGEAAGFVLVEGVSNLFDADSDDLASLRAAIKERKPALIVIDTLAMAFPGLEENNAESMSRVVLIGRKLAETGAAVILVHHDTKAQGATPRGHSVLNGALDGALHLIPRDESGVVRGRLTKNRNGTCDRDIAFRIEVEAMGFDEDGDAITVPFAAELPPGTAPAREKLTKSEGAALQILRQLARAGRADESEWREACVDGRKVSGSDKRESRATATTRAIQGLARKGLVLLRGGVARLPDEDFAGDENAFDTG